MAKKPAITGLPNSIVDDVAKGVVKGAKAVGRALSKPKSVTVRSVEPLRPTKPTSALQRGKYGLGEYRPTVKINSKPAYSSTTYKKGEAGYKEAIRGAKIKDKSLKDVNKYDAARKRRATEYNSAIEAEKVVKAQEKKYGFAVGPEEDFVKKFTKMSPRRVRSGKR